MTEHSMHAKLVHEVDAVVALLEHGSLGDPGYPKYHPAGSMAKGVALFKENGGRTVTVTPANRAVVERLHADTAKALESHRLFGATSGDLYTKRAIHNDYDPVIVAQAKTGHIAGAIQYHVHTDGSIAIPYLGSTGLTPGTGSALTRQVFRQAAKGNGGITLTADLQAVPFWEKMGFHSTTDTRGSGTRGMEISAADVKAALA